jgi:hypothetical protein
VKPSLPNHSMTRAASWPTCASILPQPDEPAPKRRYTHST